jgi:hypothetical protein
MFIAVLPGFTKASFGSEQQSYYLVRSNQKKPKSNCLLAGMPNVSLIDQPPLRCLPR